MSIGEQSPPDAGAPAPAPSVLSQLPRTRPQRSSARRSAARDGRDGAASVAKRPAAKQRKPAKKAGTASRTQARRPAAKPARPPARAARKPRTRARAEEPVPLQGYAGDGESLSGSVAPPGGPEFVATAAEIIGELAKAGASSGERVVKGLLSRLPLP